jgi:hypothetical protein
VEDDGIGIVVHHPQRNGGLGQELVKGLAHELGGHLEVKTSKRGGSTFILCMPYVGPAQSAAPSASIERNGENAKFKQPLREGADRARPATHCREVWEGHAQSEGRALRLESCSF